MLTNGMRQERTLACASSIHSLPRSVSSVSPNRFASIGSRFWSGSCRFPPARPGRQAYSRARARRMWGNPAGPDHLYVVGPAELHMLTVPARRRGHRSDSENCIERMTEGAPVFHRFTQSAVRGCPELGTKVHLTLRRVSRTSRLFLAGCCFVVRVN